MEFLSLKGGCTGSSESTLVKMPHCWKSHVMAHIVKKKKNCVTIVIGNSKLSLATADQCACHSSVEAL